MYMILFNYSTPSYLNPVRNQHYNININTKSFDKMVQDRKEQSGKVAMEELSMEGDGEKPSKNEENPGVWCYPGSKPLCEGGGWWQRNQHVMGQQLISSLGGNDRTSVFF